ncbi:CDP-diacylglycerol--glycerol-3-phosphate 3-phosphatidyltransferase [Rickettsiales bacterium]|nr:CDP-diacylglycerol--glycerol-3-phosphate 3-phosphatidyltransferase [Rickettsiales bacterium]
MNRNLPNILTAFRILIIPMLIASFYIEGRLYHWVAASLFLVAGITDFFDGYLARLYKVQSKLGKFLDPIADKLLVAAAILMLVHFDDIGKYDIIPAIAILCREIMVSGLREFLAEINVSVPVTALAKIKTMVQMLAIGLLLWGVEGPNIEEVEVMTEITLTELVGRTLLWLAAILTIITGYAYLKAGLKHMTDEK